MIRTPVFVLSLLATVLMTVAPLLSAGAPWRGVPAGRESLLTTMLGQGETLPGGCRFAGGTNAAFVVARYTCDDANLTLQLRNGDAAPDDAVRTARFAIVVHEGVPPPGFLEALVAQIRSREAELFDAQAGLSSGVAATLCGAVAIILLAVTVQIPLERWRRVGAGSDRRIATHQQRSSDPSLLVTCGLVAAYVVSRTVVLQNLPVFTDEAAHIMWARGGFGAYFTSELNVGKWLPLQVMAMFLYLPVEPLVAVRLASVTMGLATLVGCIAISLELKSGRSGLVAGAVYVALPFALLYDRLALADIYVSAFATWAVWFALRLMSSPTARPGIGFTTSLAAAILSKPTGGIVLAAPLLVAVCLVRRGERLRYLLRCSPGVLGGAALLTFLLVRGYGTQLVGGQAAFSSAGMSERVLGNLVRASEWFGLLFTPAVTLVLGVAAVVAVLQVRRRLPADGFLIALLALSVVPYVVCSTIWYPRYILLAVVPVSLLAGRAITGVAELIARPIARRSERRGNMVAVAATTALTVALLATVAPSSWQLVIEPAHAALPDIERRQYVSGSSAGYGLPELAEFLRDQAREAPINVVALAEQGPPNEGIDVYLPSAPDLRRYLVGPDPGTSAEEIENLARSRRTLLVLNADTPSPSAIPSAYRGRAERIWVHARPGGQTSLEVWEVRPRI